MMLTRTEDEAKADQAVKERAIAAIQAHNNYRGKPLGILPRWLERLCTQKHFRGRTRTS